MDRQKQFHDEILRKVNKVNRFLNQKLQKQTDQLDKMKTFVEKDRKQILYARKNIAEEIRTGRRALQMSRLNDESSIEPVEFLPEVKLKRNSIALRQAKEKFSTVLDKAKTFGQAQTEEGIESSNIGLNTLPLIAPGMHSSFFKTSPFCGEQIDSCERVLQYIENLNLRNKSEFRVQKPENELQVKSLELDDDLTDDESSSFDCEEAVSPGRTAEQVIPDPNNNNDITPRIQVQVKPQIKGKSYGGCTRGLTRLIKTRRHSVLGVTMNVPVSVPSNVRMEKFAYIEYHASTKDILLNYENKKHSTDLESKQKMKVGTDFQKPERFLSRSVNDSPGNGRICRTRSTSLSEHNERPIRPIRKFLPFFIDPANSNSRSTTVGKGFPSRRSCETSVSAEAKYDEERSHTKTRTNKRRNTEPKIFGNLTDIPGQS